VSDPLVHADDVPFVPRAGSRLAYLLILADLETAVDEAAQPATLAAEPKVHGPGDGLAFHLVGGNLAAWVSVAVEIVLLSVS